MKIRQTPETPADTQTVNVEHVTVIPEATAKLQSPEQLGYRQKIAYGINLLGALVKTKVKEGFTSGVKLVQEKIGGITKPKSSTININNIATGAIQNSTPSTTVSLEAVSILEDEMSIIMSNIKRSIAYMLNDDCYKVRIYRDFPQKGIDEIQTAFEGFNQTGDQSDLRKAITEILNTKGNVRLNGWVGYTGLAYDTVDKIFKNHTPKKKRIDDAITSVFNVIVKANEEYQTANSHTNPNPSTGASVRSATPPPPSGSPQFLTPTISPEQIENLNEQELPIVVREEMDTLLKIVAGGDNLGSKFIGLPDQAYDYVYQAVNQYQNDKNSGTLEQAIRDVLKNNEFNFEKSSTAIGWISRQLTNKFGKEKREEKISEASNTLFQRLEAIGNLTPEELNEALTQRGADRSEEQKTNSRSEAMVWLDGAIFGGTASVSYLAISTLGETAADLPMVGAGISALKNGIQSSMMEYENGRERKGLEAHSDTTIAVIKEKYDELVHLLSTQEGLTNRNEANIQKTQKEIQELAAVMTHLCKNKAPALASSLVNTQAIKKTAESFAPPFNQVEYNTLVLSNIDSCLPNTNNDRDLQAVYQGIKSNAKKGKLTETDISKYIKTHSNNQLCKEFLEELNAKTSKTPKQRQNELTDTVAMVDRARIEAKGLQTRNIPDSVFEQAKKDILRQTESTERERKTATMNAVQKEVTRFDVKQLKARAKNRDGEVRPLLEDFKLYKKLENPNQKAKAKVKELLAKINKLETDSAFCNQLAIVIESQREVNKKILKANPNILASLELTEKQTAKDIDNQLRNGGDRLLDIGIIGATAGIVWFAGDQSRKLGGNQLIKNNPLPLEAI